MKYLLSIITLFSFVHCSTSEGGSSSSTGSTNITIQVDGLPAGKADLIATYADQNFRFDSLTIDPSGKMVITRDEPFDSGLIYVMLPSKKYIQVLVGEDQEFSMKTNNADLSGNMVVEGSVDNDLFYKSYQFETEFQNQYNAIANQLKSLAIGSPEYTALKTKEKTLIDSRVSYLDDLFEKHPNTLFTKFKKAGQNPQVKEIFLSDGSPDTQGQVQQFRRDFWDNVDLEDERLIRTPVIFNKLNRYMTELTVQQPDSIISATDHLLSKVPLGSEYYKFIVNWIALKYEPTKTQLMDSEAIYVHMVQNYISYEKAHWADSAQVYALQLRAHEMGASLVGQKGPNVTANNPNGISKSIYDMTAPFVIVYLYNPTCDHCIEETPKLVRYYNENKSKGVDVYAIAIDTDQQQWTNFVQSNAMSFTNVYDPTNKAIYAKYYVDNTPEIYILDPDRNIIGKNLKVNQIQEVINRHR